MPDRDPGFVQRTVLVVGAGVLEKLPSELVRLGCAKPVVLMDEALIDGEVGERVRGLLPQAAIVAPKPGEPSVGSVAAAAGELAQHVPDGLVAVGGGSTLDTGKVSRALIASQAASIADLPDVIPSGRLPLVSVPTTAGTGAEVGAGSFIYDPAQDDKINVKRENFAAELAIADGDLTLSLPRHLSVFTGLDALAQAILAYVPAGKSSLSGEIALRAIGLILQELPKVAADTRDRAARDGMMRGSVMSALAMFNAPPIYAAEHTFAEPIGAVLKIHHGHAVAAFLPATAEFNLEPLAAAYTDISRAVGLVDARASDSQAAVALVDCLRDLVISLEVPPLADVVKSWDADDLVARSQRHEGYALNPRPLDPADAKAIIESGFSGSFRLGA